MQKDGIILEKDVRWTPVEVKSISKDLGLTQSCTDYSQIYLHTEMSLQCV